MGMSTTIVGFIPPDDKWKKMKEIWDRCVEMEIDPPDDVADFFNGEPPDDIGKEIDFRHDLKILREWNEDYGQGYELSVKDIPTNVKIIRFYNSY